MTTYEFWQQTKFGNYIPEGEINESSNEWNPGNTNGQDPEAVCSSEQPSFSYDQVGRNSEGLQSLSDSHYL